MSDPILKEIRFELHARLLHGVAGQPSPVVYARPAGALSSADGADAEQIERVLGELRESDDLLPQDGRVGRLEFGRDRCLLYAADGPRTAEEVGLLAVLLERDQAGTPALEELLVELAASIGREYRLHSEANALAVELSERHEELNLLYSLDGYVREFERGSEGVETLLQNLTERLEIDLAAFVLSTRSAPIHVTGPSCTISNLDLVLTAIRGDLFRFASARQTPVVLNAEDDPRRQYLLVNMPYRVLACPVTAGRVTRGMLVLLRDAGQPDFTNADRNLAMVIARQLAIMMQNHSMLNSLENFGAQMAAALIAAIESKDPYTRGHSERVQKSSVELGRAACLRERAVEDVSWGALLHDVGKIGIPDAILCKAGSLTEDEYSMIKTHPERSFEIMGHIEHLGRGAIEAARYHHERFDGTGYPHGLRGEEIPIAARVIAVADTYDAITSSRSYRAARDHAAALEILVGVAGSQLDADLVQVFANMFDRGGAAPSAGKDPAETPDG